MNIEEVFQGKFEKDNKDKYFGKFRAVVKVTDDPEKLGRIKVKCPDIYGKSMSPWAWPCLPYGGVNDNGMFFIPEKESGVWIEFEQGCPTNPIWTGFWWTKPNGTNEVPTEATDKYKDVKIIKTKAGHTIEFCDKDGTEYVKITNGVNGSYAVLGEIVEIYEGNSGSIIKLDNPIEITNGATGSFIKIGQNIIMHAEGNVIIEVPNGHVDVR